MTVTRFEPLVLVQTVMYNAGVRPYYSSEVPQPQPQPQPRLYMELQCEVEEPQ
jgi:hypothetical protein